MLLTLVLVCAAALVVLLAVPAFIVLRTHNRLVALDQRCDTAFADIDAHLKHRHNLIPPLVEAVRVFTKHENDVLLGVTEARAAALQATTPEMQLSAEKNLTQNINALIGMAERYPELKEYAARMAEMAGQVEALGCFLKDIDQGLIDFPYEIEDDVVFLCWQSGERQIIAWHTIDSGFSDRRPLPGVNTPYLN